MLSTVSPKTADPALRIALIEAAARLIAEEGSAGLSLRRLASEAGTSTMAIYTHFGSMDEVRRAVRLEGFARLASRLSAVEETGDTVADLTLLGWAYYANAVTNPHLYRAMFMERPIARAHDGIGIETFVQLVSGVDRCIRAGRFDPADPVELATQVWSMEHGIVALHLAGFLSAEQALATFSTTGGHLMKAFGDDAAALGRSFATAQRRARAAQAASDVTS
jgi:AcrR family transcriptional regulator